jgi:hypothetical protein
VLAGCGGKPKTAAQRVADCLNAKDFLVGPAGGRVEGTSPRGVAFSVVVASGTIDDRGNPGKRRLSPTDRRSIEACLD